MTATTIHAGALTPGLTRDAALAKARVTSIDRLRGAVMLIMALDHVRDYMALTAFDPIDPAATDAGWFLTRFITHFCAPVFILLSGISAALHQQAKGLGPAALARFLISRGVWLILLEVTLLTFLWQFGYQYAFLQVIWAIGWSMVILAGLVFLPRPVILVLSLAVIAGHNLLDGIEPAAFGALAPLWHFLHMPGVLDLWGSTAPEAFLLYPVMPWFAVMALGYAMAPLFQKPAVERDRTLMMAGLATLAAFVLLRLTNLYGDPQPWTPFDGAPERTLFSFLNVAKYPPSLLYVLLTVGVALVAMPVVERLSGAIPEAIAVFGRVPFFYYILHIPVVHGLGLVWNHMLYGTSVDMCQGLLTGMVFPPGYEAHLPVAYMGWALVVAALYLPCRWFAGVKARRKDWWLSYL